MESLKRISLEKTSHLAWLAKIELTDEEKKLFTEQLNKILDFFREIDKVDTSNVPPTYHVLPISNVFREDEPKSSLSQEEALKNAFRRKDGFFIAPKIV